MQREIHQDWANREYIEVITSSIKKIADFLNSFGEGGGGRGRRGWRAGAGARGLSLPLLRRHVVPVPAGHPEREADGPRAQDRVHRGPGERGGGGRPGGRERARPGPGPAVAEAVPLPGRSPRARR